MTAPSVSATATATGQTTAVTSCTALATDDVQCVNGAGSTVRVEYTPTATEDAPAQFTGCHEHDGEGLFCFSPDGEDVAVVALGQTTAVTSCSATATNDVRCVNGAGSTVHVMHTPTATEDVPAQYTGCHSHGADETFCFSPEGEDVAVVALNAGSSSSSSSGSSERSCHFHGPVEHCVGGDESEAEEALDCGMSDYSYNIPLRVGMIFVVLVTSGIGVYAPMVISKLPLGGKTIGNALQMLKQFGTGIIISTAFIHLYSHAELYLSNQCIRWPVYYEGTTSAIVMAGLFISFLIDFIAHRYVGSRTRSASTSNPDGASATSSTESPSHDAKAAAQQPPNNPLLMFDHHSHGNGGSSDNDKLSVTLMEVGIVFHSILIGLTLSVTPDQAFRTLLVVIIFHQFFEGLALGARISLLPNTSIFPRKFLMAGAFTLITPIGMAIGLGVVKSFNGNDPSTMISFGTLNALSAGILIWVGVVDMWARDWVIEGGEMLKTSTVRTAVAMVFFVSGLVLMSVLGKWA
ncbi:zip zinc transporter like protein [Zymoseptoria brevis]|uniref:Zip zinc transporter like protein n=1 Tax=Zymoseptoria brevis TaxID=1047168 RepID=A0A0F4GXW0_9PEZI|nr:zip zinc transporter like protein [Zymoseptoria brevis]